MPSAGPFPSPVMPTQRDADVPNQRVAEQHAGPTLNLAGSSSGTAIARISVQAIGPRFSARTSAVPIPDASLRGALS